MTKLKLHNKITPEKLIKAGFRQQLENTSVFRFRERLYKSIIYIYISIRIDLSKESKEQIEWNIIDNNTGLGYNTFYFTPNTGPFTK